jgi:hypothetical protein
VECGDGKKKTLYIGPSALKVAVLKALALATWIRVNVIMAIFGDFDQFSVTKLSIFLKTIVCYLLRHLFC